MIDWLDQNPHIVIPAYLIIGFITGIVILKRPDGRCEEPAGVLLMCIFFWIIGLAIAVLVGICWLLNRFLALIGIHAHHSDNHGV